jgi:hypothetical protein
VFTINEIEPGFEAILNKPKVSEIPVLMSLSHANPHIRSYR